MSLHENYFIERIKLPIITGSVVLTRATLQVPQLEQNLFTHENPILMSLNVHLVSSDYLTQKIEHNALLLVVGTLAEKHTVVKRNNNSSTFKKTRYNEHISLT